LLQPMLSVGLRGIDPASTRLPIPALLGSFENPTIHPDPVAVSRFSISSASQRSAPSPSTKTVPTARYGPSGDDGADIPAPVDEPRSLSRTRPVTSRATTVLPYRLNARPRPSGS